MNEQKAEAINTLADLGFTLTGRFVPFSHSRNAAEKHPSLNWKLTLSRNGRVVLADLDYAQGSAWAPAYKLSAAVAGSLRSIMRDKIIRSECETGKVAVPFVPGGRFDGGHNNVKPLPLPAIEDVLSSLFMDAEALNSGGFKEWCADYGYNDDSIKAKETFDVCVEIGMKLKACMSSAEFERASELAAEY